MAKSSCFSHKGLCTGEAAAKRSLECCAWRHKDDSGHWHDAEVKVHGDQLVITHKDEDA